MNKLLITIMLLSMVVLIAFGQTSTPTSLYLVAKHNSPLPSCPSCSLTANATFNNILTSFGVTSFQKVFQGATNETLSKTYRIKATGNLASLKTIVDNSQFFTLTELGYSGQSLGTASATYPSNCSNPQYVNDQWITQGWSNDKALEMSDAYCAWTLTHGNPNLKIAVIDEPINPSHPDFKDATGAFKVTVKSLFNPIPTHDSHGTRVTGAICAQANNNQFTASIGHDLRVNHYTYNQFSDIPLLIWEAYQFGNKVINLSNVIGYNNIEILMIKEVIANGCTIVVGAGNSPGGKRQGVNTWNIPGFIIVSGVGPDNKHSTGSINGIRTDEYTGVDLCAPANMISTIDIMNGVFTVRDGWGTSFAAPQVTAVVGLMLSVNPCLSPMEIEGILNSTTEPIADANLYPGTIGTGRLNAYKAVLKAQNYGSDVLTVNNGEVKTIQWVDYFQKITVKKGGTLHIKNTTLYMAQNGRIHIEPGGKVYVLNSTLKAREPFNGCDFPRYVWDGIAIAGEPNLDQWPYSNQGYISVVNSTIQDARNAISTFSLDAFNNIIWSKTGGGIIHTRNSIFKRNGRHIEFYGYNRKNNQNNVCSFLETTFEYEGSVDIASGNRAYYMITAFGVRGVRFTGCTFKNTLGSINADLNGYDRGTGIYTVDASFLINETQNAMDCSPLKQGQFSDLSYGLKLMHSPSASYASRVKQQTFLINDKSIYVSNGLATTIDHNTFNLNVPNNYYNRKMSINDPTYKTGILGIYAPNASGYRIEQNSFINPSTQVSREIIIGFVPDNSDANGGGGYYRLNTTNNPNIATQTQNKNGKLEISCNEHTSCGVGINLNPLSVGLAVPSFSECSQFGATLQEDYENTFIQNSMDLSYYPPLGFNSTHTYVIRSGAPNRPSQSKSSQVIINPCTHVQTKPVLSKNCAPHELLKEACNRVVIGKDFGNDKAKFKTAKKDYIDVKNTSLYAASVPLVQMVQQGLSIPAATLYTILVNNSPFLSDEVLLSMLIYSSHLTEQELVTILIANTGLSAQVWQAVVAKNFTPTLFAQLETAQQNTTLASDANTAYLSYLEKLMVNSRNEIVVKANLLQLEESENDITFNYIDTIIDFLKDETDIEAKKQLIATYYLVGKYQDALQTLNQLAINDNEENTTFRVYYNLLLQAYIAGRNVYTFTKSEWNVLRDLALTETTSGYAAKGLLGLIKGDNFAVYVERATNSAMGKVGINEVALNNQVAAKKMLVYPNPSNQLFTVQFMLPANSKNIKLKITDIAGKAVYDTDLKHSVGNVKINSLDWENGIYIIQMYTADGVVETQKLVVGH